MKVAIIMGSTSDLPKVEPAISILKNYGVEVNVRCLSAHRAHLGLSSFIKETETDGTEVIITAAGMAAALPGVVASQTVLPVIGVPIAGSNLDGIGCFITIVQMPSGIPGCIRKRFEEFKERIRTILHILRNYVAFLATTRNLCLR